MSSRPASATSVFVPLARAATVAVVVVAAGCSAEVTRFNLNLLGGNDTTTGTIPPPWSKSKEDAFGYKAPPKNSAIPPASIEKKLADLNPPKDPWRDPPKDYYREPPKDYYSPPPKNYYRAPPGPPPTFMPPEHKSESKVEPPEDKQPPSSATVEVKPGDTLYSIARRHGVTASALKELNGLSSTSVRPGQRLVLPGAVKDSGPVAKTDPFSVFDKAKADAFDKAKADPLGKAAPPMGEATSAKLTGVKEAAKQPPADQPPRVVQVKPRLVKVEEEPKAEAKIKTAKRTDTATDTGPPPAIAPSRFRWPLHGKVIMGFGAKLDGAKNDGIHLAASLGAEVRAAEAGRVHYVGALKGYGNMVLIRHSDEWATAYGYVDQILVKVNDEVKRGQVIAKVGKGGASSQPQLKFELRRASVPVDPLEHLPN
jgi:murein DD-endopeptidase MepM/ murein hydrolase activator NlpD